ncbi:MAG TPA: hypothetical protein VFS88_08880 [Micavibrio sp.]|nr:hypothetical protein [Micavibrio sp.]
MLIVPAAVTAMTAVSVTIARIVFVIAGRMMLSVILRIIIRAIVALAAIIVSGRMAGALMGTVFGMIAIRHRGGRENHEKGERKQKNAEHHRFPLVVAVAALIFSAGIEGAATVFGSAVIACLLFGTVIFAIVVLILHIAGIIVVVGADSGVTVITGDVASDRGDGEKGERKHGKGNNTDDHHGLLI